MASMPSPPDPFATAAAQGAASREATIASGFVNNPNQVTPFGTLTTDITGSYQGTDAQGNKYTVPLTTRTVELSDDEQAKLDSSNALQIGLLDAGNRQLDQINDALADPFTLDGMPEAPTSVGAPRLNSQLDQVGPDRVSGVNVPNFDTSVGKRPTYQTSVQGQNLLSNLSGQNFQTGVGGLGQATTGYGSGGQVQNVGLNSMFGSNVGPLPGYETNIDGQTFQTGVNMEGANRGYASGGQAQNVGLNSMFSGDVGQLPGYQTSVGMEGLRRGYDSGNVDLNTNFNGSVNSPDFVTNIQRQDMTGGVDMSQAATGYAPEDGFSADRARVVEALYNRMDPQFERDYSAMENRLVAQGHQRGSASFNAAMDELRRQQNDARFQAEIYGGQEQSRLLGEARAEGQFGNSAVAQNNAAAIQQAMFEREGRQQQLSGDIARANAMNAGRGQQFGADLAAAEFGNDAIRSANDTLMAERGFNNAANLAAGQFENAAIAGDNASNLAAAQFGNAAQAQGFADRVTANQIGNSALEASNSALLAQYGFNNAAAAQRTAENRDAASFENAAIGQDNQAALAAAGFGNDARAAQASTDIARANAINSGLGQGFDDRVTANQVGNQSLQAANDALLAQYGFNNAATAQRDAMARDAALFGNSAVAQNNAALMDAARFGNEGRQQQLSGDIAQMQAINEALGQQFGIDLSGAQFGNDAKAQRFSDDIAKNTAENAARSQLFAANMASAQQTNAVRDAEFAEEMARTSFTNSVQNQRFDNRMESAAYAQDARGRAIQEALLERTQPLNEMAAAVSGSPLNMPAFESMYRQGIEPEPVADSVWRAYEAEAQQAQAFNSGLFGLLSAPFSMF